MRIAKTVVLIGFVKNELPSKVASYASPCRCVQILLVRLFLVR